MPVTESFRLAFSPPHVFLTSAVMSYYAYTATPRQLRDFGRLFGLDKLHLLPSMEAIDTSCLVGSNDEYTVVAIAGTQNPRQWASYISDVGLDHIQGIVGGVFRPFNSIFQKVWHRIKDLPELSGRKFLLCGHSLGGACAVILGRLILAEQRGPIQGIFTLGSPRPGTPSFVRAVQCPGARIISFDDPVPQTPPALLRTVDPNLLLSPFVRLEHWGQAFALDHAGRVTHIPDPPTQEAFIAFARAAKGQSVIGYATAHPSGNYLRLLDRFVSQADAAFASAVRAATGLV